MKVRLTETETERRLDVGGTQHKRVLVTCEADTCLRALGTQDPTLARQLRARKALDAALKLQEIAQERTLR